MEGIASVAALQATRSARDESSRPLRDLLLLHTNKRLGLYVGNTQICHVTVSLDSLTAAPAFAKLLGGGSPNQPTGGEWQFLCGHNAACWQGDQVCEICSIH